MVRVAGIDVDRVQHRPVGGALLGPLAPRRPGRVVVPPLDRRPRVAPVLGVEQALGASRPRTSSPVAPGGRASARRRARSERPSGSPAGNAGGRAASCQVRPRSSERSTVGPRWPVRTATRSRRWSRGSRTAWCTTWPSSDGPATDHLCRSASAARIHRPLRVPTSSQGPAAVGVGGRRAVGGLPRRSGVAGPGVRRRGGGDGVGGGHGGLPGRGRGTSLTGPGRACRRSVPPRGDVSGRRGSSPEADRRTTVPPRGRAQTSAARHLGPGRRP